MDFGRQRGFLPMERTRLRRWAVEKGVIFWSSCTLMLSGILLVWFSMSFFMVPRAPIATGIVVVLSSHIRSTSIPKALYLVSFSVVLTEVLVSRGI